MRALLDSLIHHDETINVADNLCAIIRTVRFFATYSDGAGGVKGMVRAKHDTLQAF